MSALPVPTLRRRNPTTPTTVGRKPATTASSIASTAIKLFTLAGFEETSVDNIAAAVGISRRTIFSYYPSKNAIVWGDFQAHLAEMRRLLSEVPPTFSLADALGSALVEFNRVPTNYLQQHRQRMQLVFKVPALQAYSTLMYTEWRQVVADFVGARLNLAPESYVPQTCGWMLLGVAVSAYEQWLCDDSADLSELIISCFSLLTPTIDTLELPTNRNTIKDNLRE